MQHYSTPRTEHCVLRMSLSDVVFQDAFSLLAYQDPWSSPVGYQLDPVQREPICAALNSAILGEPWIQHTCVGTFVGS